MLRILYVFFLAFLLSFPASPKSKPVPLSTVNSGTEQLQQQINQLQTDLKATKNDQEDHEKLIVLTTGLAALEKRVGDFGLYITLLGILIAVIIIFFAVRTSGEAIVVAKQEAKQAAEKEVKIWLADNFNPLKDSLETQTAKLIKKIDRQGFDSLQRMKALENEHKRILVRQSVGQGPRKVMDPKDMLDLQFINNLIRQKSENYYTFDEWHSLFIEAEYRKALDELEKYIVGMERTAKDNWQIASAKTGRADLLSERQQYDDAIKLCDEIVDEYGATDNPQLIERVANALCKKGWVLDQKGQLGDAIAVYDEVVSRFGARREADIAERVARALVSKGSTLDQQPGQLEAAITVYNEVVSYFGERSEAGIAEQVAGALVKKGWVLHKQDKLEDAIAVYNDVESRFGTRSEAGIAAMVAGALVSKGDTLYKQGQPEIAIAIYNDVVSRYGSRSETGIAELAAGTLVKKGDTLYKQGQLGDAIAVYDEVVSRFGARREAGIAEYVEKANKAINKLSNVKDKV